MSKRRCAAVLIVLLVPLLACRQKANEADQGATCTRSAQCAADAVCDHGVCQPSYDCAARGCGDAEVCANDGQCGSIEALCQSAGGCQCYFVDLTDTARQAPQGATYVLSAGTKLAPRAVLRTAAGNVLTAPMRDLAVDDGAGASAASFDVQDGQLVATGAEGAAQMHASLAGTPCVGTLLNVGAAPSDGRVRAFVFDTTTGLPVAGARVLFAAAGAGGAADQAPLTDAQGLAQSAEPVQPTYEVSVFSATHHYVTLMGLTPMAGSHLMVPLVPVELDTPPAAREASYGIDFAGYEQTQLDDAALALRFALGGEGSAVLDPTATSGASGTEVLAEMLGCDPSTQSCLPIKYVAPDGSQIALSLRIPAPLVLDSLYPEVQSIIGKKPRLSLQTGPQQGTAWVLGGETTTGPLLGLQSAINQVAAAWLSLSPQPQVGEDLGAGLQALYEVLPALALGLVPSDPQQPIALRAPMRRFAAVALPDFPADSPLDTVSVVAARALPGGGLVPMGIGLGLRCTQGDCFALDAVMGPQVASTALCKTTACPVGTQSQVGPGELALFEALPFGGLETQEAVYVVTALAPRLSRAGQASVVAGFVAHQPALHAQPDALKSYVWPTIPASVACTADKRLALPDAVSSRGLSRLSISLVDDEMQPAARRWDLLNVGQPADTPFRFPTAPASFAADLHVDFQLVRTELALDVPAAALIAGLDGGLAALTRHTLSFAQLAPTDNVACAD